VKEAELPSNIMKNMKDIKKEFDFVAIGDITTDAFIHITNASVYHDNKSNEDKICLTNGAKIPYDFTKVIPGVGNSPNAAVSATRLGLKTALVTNLGDDDNGKEILRALEKNDIDDCFVRVHENKNSNYHYILWHGTERTILIKHEEYNYELPDIGEPKWIYLSSVGENSLEYHQALVLYFNTHPNTKIAFQPGTYQVKLGYEKLKEVYKLTEVFFCNLQEAQTILQTNESSGTKLVQEISLLGPKIVVITDGEKGAYACDALSAWFIPVYPTDKPPLERTGAGDSFASSFISALALGRSIEEALSWGAINASFVVHHIGAQEGLLSHEELEKHLKNCPENYRAEKI